MVVLLKTLTFCENKDILYNTCAIKILFCKISQMTMYLLLFMQMFSFLYHCQDFYRTWLYIWVTRRLSYKKQELLTLCEHMSSVGSSLLIFFVFYVVLLCVITCLVLCCDVRDDFRIKWCSVLLYPLLFVGGLVSYLCYLCLFVYSGVQYVLCCIFLRPVYPVLYFSSSCVPCVVFFFVLCTLCCIFLRPVYPVLPDSLDCLFVIALSVFSNVYL
jgi:hypothetical protein